MFSSCIIHGPRYSRVEKVLELRIGMHYKEVNSVLATGPYDLKSIDSLGNRTLIYKYRVTDRRTLPFLLKENNGQSIRGKFVDLYATFNVKDTLKDLYAMRSESELKEKKLNINTLLTFLTVTAPAFLIYLGK